MKTREVTTAAGETFTVPQGIQRLDSPRLRGWQVRYHGTKYFADGTVGAAKSLENATKELMRRIATMPAPVLIKRTPSPTKSSQLPPGISGPIVVKNAEGQPMAAVLAVLVPRFGEPNQLKRVHIGTPNNYTLRRYKTALAKAIEIRAEGLAAYEAAATRAKRREANQLKKELRETRRDA